MKTTTNAKTSHNHYKKNSRNLVVKTKKFNPFDRFKEQRSYQIFFEAIISPATKKHYPYGLDKFMEFSKIPDYDSVLKTENIQDILEDFVRDLTKKGAAYSSANLYLSAVILFLEMNKVIFHKKVLKKLLPKDRKIEGGDVLFTTEEIRRMLSVAKIPRTRALILFFVSTGARPAVLIDPPLKIKHLEQMEQGCKSMKLYEDSSDEYFGFLTPETVQAIEDYLDVRRTKGEVLTGESYLFKTGYKATHEYMTIAGATTTMYKIFELAGIERTKSKREKYDKALFYGFRKRFNTILKLNNSVNSNIAEKLMAHKNGLDGVYLKPTKKECFREFIKAVSEITIDPSQRQNAEIESLKQQNKQLQNQEIEIEVLKEMLEESRIPPEEWEEIKRNVPKLRLFKDKSSY